MQWPCPRWWLTTKSSSRDGAGARGDRFLSDVAVRGALDHAGEEELDRALVEAADAHHGPVQGFQFLGLHLGLLPWCAAVDCSRR